MIQTGIFNEQSFRNSPDLRDKVEEKLCGADLTLVGLQAGFGVDTEVFGSRVGVEDHFLSPSAYLSNFEFSPELATQNAQRKTTMDAWKNEHCQTVSQPPPRPPEASTHGLSGWYVASDIARHYWLEVRALLPPQLSQGWTSCIADLAWNGIEDQAKIRCRAVELELTQGEEHPEIYFTVDYHRYDGNEPNLLPIPYFPPKLRVDLKVIGADCESPPWRKGMRLSSRRATLRCRRLGTAPVSFVVETSQGDCSVSVP